MRQLIVLVLLFSLNIGLNGQEKIEPPFWWSGMKSTNLQLLIYGDSINQLEPEFDSSITVMDVKRVDNPNYLFVTIKTDDVKPGDYQLRLKRQDSVIHNYTYRFKERRKNSAQRKGFDSSDVIYLLMPDRFANGNPGNDNQDSVKETVNRSNPDGRHGGDIAGILEHLDYIKKLGVTAIWSTPLLEDNEPQGSYHGYAQSDYYKIDPRFGTNEEYKKLSHQLHKKDMKLIMDYVTNHWGSESWIIKDLPSKDWIHNWPKEDGGFKRSNYELTTQFDSNAAEKDKALTTDGWFDVSMPDMNQSNPLVLNYMVQNAIWWIEYADLDGLRVDTYPYNDKKGIAEWTKRILREYPNLNIVGEVWMHNASHIAYWQKDSKVGGIQHYNSHLPSVMDFPLNDAIMEGFQANNQDWGQGMKKVYESFTNDFLYPDVDNLMVFLENHDTNRFNNVYEDFDTYKLALTLIATIRGIPQIYYGSEIGMKGNKDKGDGDIRQDFPGGWENDETNAFTKKGRTKRQQKYYNFTKKLLNWRKGKTVIHKGKTLHFVPKNNVYVYFRYNSNDRVMVIINNSPEQRKLALERFSEGLKDAKRGRDIISERDVPLNDTLKIKGKTAMVIELE